MRILVFSDSHRIGALAMQKAIEQQPNAEVVIFLGDGASDFENCREYIKDKRVYFVKGNNDFHCGYPLNMVISEGNINIYITHGHYEYVKSTMSYLLSKAQENKCTLALYGHTHNQKSDYCDGVYMFNPGALMNNQYGVVDITNNGLICIGMEVR